MDGRAPAGRQWGCFVSRGHAVPLPHADAVRTTAGGSHEGEDGLLGWRQHQTQYVVCAAALGAAADRVPGSLETSCVPLPTSLAVHLCVLFSLSLGRRPRFSVLLVVEEFCLLAEFGTQSPLFCGFVVVVQVFPLFFIPGGVVCNNSY